MSPVQRRRVSIQKVAAAIAAIGCSVAPLAFGDGPTTAPVAQPGFTEALPLMPAGAPTTAPADIAAVILEGVTIPAPPTTTDEDDKSIAAAATAYRKMFDNARQAGERPNQADMGDYVDSALEKWTLSKLSLPQIARLIETLPIIYAPKSGKTLDAQLAELEKGSDADAAKAGIVRLQTLPFNIAGDIRAQRVEAVLAHPGLSAAVAKGDGAAIFSAAASLDAENLKATAPKFNQLASNIPNDAPPAFYDTAARFQLAVGHALKPDDLKTFETFRSTVAAAATKRLDGAGLDEDDKERLTTAVDQLEGAFARGELVGHTAPAIDFIAFSDPADPSHKITSLADLKGKIVVLDFWATWCGPCVASFPKVKALSRYYRGFDVVVIGVTSPQGFVALNGSRIDTSEDVNKEISLVTTDFAKSKDMTWPIAVSKQSVFNPAYGITGIPSVVILDATGAVRYAGLHPASELDEKVALIDPLLAEAKLPLPARMMMPKPAKAEPAKGS
jgi:thiol-disulfide isomerase/thioredoxin